MNNRIQNILQFISNNEHHKFRKNLNIDLATDFSNQNLLPIKRMSKRLSIILKNESPLIIHNERIAFTRTIKKLPPIFTTAEWNIIKNTHYIHELGNVFNITPNYEYTIRVGLEQRRKEATDQLKLCRIDNDKTGIDFLESMIETINAIEDLADRYREKAVEMGYREIAYILERIPKYGARSFHEALQFFRILHFTLWCEGEYHNTIGRFDQYIYPYLKNDIENKILDEEDAFELLEEFFISFNKDSDLYHGVQQGDNGQSLVLGGVDKTGNYSFNLLSEMCLKASKDLKLIDPKINLRVNKETDIGIFEMGTELTKAGLGFPQYLNDDIVIPGLIKKGYSEDDARGYAMAACWEVTIPGYGMDLPNIEALSFPSVINDCLHNNLLLSYTFDEFFSSVKTRIRDKCNKIASDLHNLWMVPAPFISLLMNGCIDKARDISIGGKYNNFGIHGTGLSTAVDSLAAIRKYVFKENKISTKELISAVDNDFEGYQELLDTLRFHAPKMGNNDDEVDDIAVKLLETFANALTNLRNERGGVFRAGTGSAMYYLWHAKEIGASPDGRRKGEPLSANYSPSIFAKLRGPLSVIKSFTKPNLKEVVNGGPLTMEFHENMFKDEKSKKKVAMFVKTFINLGGNQLQLNAVNRDTLLKAQKDPDSYKNLIVRVWGWSAYFVELDKEYQDHIIKRCEFE